MMSKSWDKYFSHYSDWDESHCFNVRIELKFEDKLKSLGYVEKVISEDLFMTELNLSDITKPKSKTYIKNENEISISFEVPYDW